MAISMKNILSDINHLNKKYRLILLAFLILICLNYNPQLLFKTSYPYWGWNLSLLASVLIIISIKFRDPTNWKQKLGIDFSRKDYSGFAITTIALLASSYFLVDYLADISSYSFKPQIFHYKHIIGEDYPFHSILGNYLYYIPETFNEEMLIGALLLLGLERNFKKINKNVIAIIVALSFSLMHQLLYKYSPAQNGIILTTTTIMTLFFVGILRNVLILKTRKIAYSWAIHLSFNLVFFSGYFINKSTGYIAVEPERFNIVFGNLVMMMITGFIALASLMWLNMNKFNIIDDNETRNKKRS